jgi:DNA invertase Pin-like site-specific DNA recombinase
VVAEYVDRESGVKKRAGFDAKMDAAYLREFDMILFTSVDRFSREGVANISAGCKIDQ